MKAQSPDVVECFTTERVHTNVVQSVQASSVVTTPSKRENHNVTTAFHLPSLSFLHQFDDIVQGADIPCFLNEHQTTLRFPEKVSDQAVL
jgi:hypothetical protein